MKALFSEILFYEMLERETKSEVEIYNYADELCKKNILLPEQLDYLKKEVNFEFDCEDLFKTDEEFRDKYFTLELKSILNTMIQEYKKDLQLK